MARIHLSPPDVGVRERERLLNAFDSNWIAPVGPELNAFEALMCEVVGVPHAVALSSGTAALHLALIVAGVGPGDEVLVPTLTFAATANAVRYVGAWPVLVDVDPETWTIAPDLVEQACEADPPPKAVIPVDLYGQCAAYERLVPMAEAAGAVLIEDAAEALGATRGGRAAGSFGQAGVFSFNGNKIITTSGGGMLVSHDEAFVSRVRHLATQAREPALHYEHRDVGYNYRLSNLLASLGCAQLEGLDDKVRRRRAIRHRYAEAFGDLPGVSLMPDAPGGEPTNWLTVVLVDPTVARCGRDEVIAALDRHDVEARPAWKPMHLQPAFAGARVLGGGVAERIFEHGVCLPSGSSLADADQDRVIEIVRAALDPA